MRWYAKKLMDDIYRGEFKKLESVSERLDTVEEMLNRALDSELPRVTASIEQVHETVKEMQTDIRATLTTLSDRIFSLAKDKSSK